MTTFFKSAAALAAVVAFGIFFFAFQNKKQQAPLSHSPLVASKSTVVPKIQVAILLDVSNSMDGLIDQAKAQLWNMVSVMGNAKCNGATPQIEIALYEYGSPRNNEKAGFVKQLSAFTTDLDSLSKNLFSLTTDGGDEYCGQVIFTSINDLAWDGSDSSYKVIFIAGNEDFLQGSLHYARACQEAKKRGIIVNTIYCGDRMRGIQEHWNLGAECGGGSFTNINQDAKMEDIPTPYDSSLMVLNERLNGTYIGYGSMAVAGYSKQAFADASNFKANKSVAMKRIAVKGKKELYKNSTWDMVDASDGDEKFVDKLDPKTLPDSLKNKTRTELKQLVKIKKEERDNLQAQIGNLSVQREAYLVEARKKKAGDNQQTLETETEKLIKRQAKKFNMVID
ncbi:MAG TPA: vWA domain-containing protein [Flavisolibacter sp.]|nr:vWA domain-containing protein [Flavisolibacter sp.]